MNQTEKWIAGVLSGALALLLTYLFWDAIVTAVMVGAELALVGIYLGWLYVKRNARHWIPAAILAGCLLSAAFMNTYVFKRAEIVSYSQQTGLFSDIAYYEPDYAGEDGALLLFFFSPLLGFIALGLPAAKEHRTTHALHYLALVVLLYPMLAFSVYLATAGTKPRYHDSTALPPLGTRYTAPE